MKQRKNRWLQISPFFEGRTETVYFHNGDCTETVRRLYGDCAETVRRLYGDWENTLKTVYKGAERDYPCGKHDFLIQIHRFRSARVATEERRRLLRLSRERMVSRAGHCTYSAGCRSFLRPSLFPVFNAATVICQVLLLVFTAATVICQVPLTPPFFNVDVNVRCSKEWVCLEAPAFNERLCKSTLKRG